MTAAVGWLADQVVAEQEGKTRKTALYDEVSWVFSDLLGTELMTRAGRDGLVGRRVRSLKDRQSRGDA